MIVNELNGSAAETGAFMFKLGKVGQIVGKRTYGGGIGPYYFTPSLLDGGRVQLPGRAAYDPSGTGWGIENVGVNPDHDIEITPADVMAGRDPQLLKAIEVAMAQIPKNPMYAPKRPAFPVHPGQQAQAPIGGILMSALPQVGSAFPAPKPRDVAAAQPEVPAVTSGKFASVIGSYDAGPMGVLVVRQEGDKLWALAPNAERIELVPESVADKFIAQPVGAPVSFERDTTGKVVGITVLLPGNREVKGKKTL
jgi:hypothetical protein